MIKKIHVLFYLFLSILILSFTLKPGYIILLDMPFSYNFITKRALELFYGFAQPDYGGLLIFLLFVKLLTYIANIQFIEKLILLSILCASGIGAYSLVDSKSRISQYFAGIIYMLNPFVYVRFLAGHWTILLGYAVLPFAVRGLINFLKEPTKYNSIKAAFLLTLVGIFNIHILFLCSIIFFIFLIFKLLEKRDRRLIEEAFALIIFFLLLSMFWLLPLFTANAKLVDNLTESDIYSFSPTISSFNAVFTISSMYGFWRDGYTYAKDFLPRWQILFAFILFLSVHGFISYYKDEKIGIYVKSFAVIAIVGLLLAAGIQSPLSKGFLWIFDNTLLKGMRDTHKFVALLALAYAYLGALGVEDLYRRTNNDRRKYITTALVALAIVTPFVYSFTFFNGFAGQIKPTDYPADWYEINEFLNTDQNDFKVLFLPWHMYMDFHWISNRDKRIANPAQHFFDKEVISGKNIEIGGIYRQVNSPDQLYIDFLLSEQGNITNLGELLAPLNIKYILLTKEADYRKYSFLFNQTDLEPVKETGNFYVFRNRHEVAKIYEADSIVYISGWKELLERSRKEDITERIYLIGRSKSLGNTQENSSKGTVDYHKESPVKYELKEGPFRKYLVFTEPYSESWELDGKKPLAAYGVVNAYEVSDADAGEIRYERFYKVYLSSYILSALVFIILIALYLDMHIKTLRVIREKD